MNAIFRSLINAGVKTTSVGFYHPPSTTVTGNLQTVVKRFFSSQVTPSKVSSLVGKAPSEPVLLGEPGYDLVAKNMQFYRDYNRPTVFSHADIEKLKNVQALSSKESSFFEDLFKEIRASNEEMRESNSIMKQLSLNIKQVSLDVERLLENINKNK